MYAGNEILDNTVFAQTWPLVSVPVGHARDDRHGRSARRSYRLHRLVARK